MRIRGTTIEVEQEVKMADLRVDAIGLGVLTAVSLSGSVPADGAPHIPAAPIKGKQPQ